MKQTKPKNIMKKIKQCPKRTLHSSNCSNTVRQSKEINGLTVTLLGKYGFEWQVAIESKNTGILLFTYANRTIALKEYNKIR